MSTAAAADRVAEQTVTLLRDGAAALHVELADAQVETLVGYLGLLQRWNRTYNLTSLRDPVAMTTHHLLDCLAAVRPLRRELAGAKGRRLLDVGSGAGLPGLVFGIALPEIDVLCLDSIGKKTAFVQQAVASLGIRNVDARHQRIESLQAAPFDLITSRAFASLSDFVAGSRSLLAADGCWMAMKGIFPSEEVGAMVGVRCHVEPLHVPFVAAERCLVWIVPNESERTLSLVSLPHAAAPTDGRTH